MEIGLKHNVFVSDNIINKLKQMNDLFRQLLGQNEYVYKNNDLEINFKMTAITKEYIDVVHKGWATEQGLGEIRFLVKDNIHIIIVFRSDDQSERIYLKLLLGEDYESLTVLEGDHEGIVLNRVIDEIDL